jgi:hypothetical protein
LLPSLEAFLADERSEPLVEAARLQRLEVRSVAALDARTAHAAAAPELLAALPSLEAFLADGRSLLLVKAARNTRLWDKDYSTAYAAYIAQGGNEPVALAAFRAKSGLSRPLAWAARVTRLTAYNEQRAATRRRLAAADAFARRPPDMHTLDAKQFALDVRSGALIAAAGRQRREPAARAERARDRQQTAQRLSANLGAASAGRAAVADATLHTNMLLASAAFSGGESSAAVIAPQGDDALTAAIVDAAVFSVCAGAGEQNRPVNCDDDDE